jgi:hypothetical protein
MTSLQTAAVTAAIERLWTAGPRKGKRFFF